MYFCYYCSRCVKKENGNDGPFVDKELQKAIWPVPGSEIKYKKILRKKTKWYIKSKETFVYLQEEYV